MIYRVPVQVDEISQVKALNFAKIIICVQNHLKHVQIFEKILPLIMSSILKKNEIVMNNCLTFTLYHIEHSTGEESYLKKSNHPSFIFLSLLSLILTDF